MPRILAVNNYPSLERFERLATSLETVGAAVTRADWTEASKKKFDAYDGVVLSGSPDMMSSRRVQEKFAGEVEAILEAKVPVLGVCFGHQMMAHAFGSRVVEDSQHVLKFVRTDVARPEELFEGLRSPLSLLESRHEVVASLPEGFELLASSETTEIAAMKHRKRPLFGIQSHPERFTKSNGDGLDVVANFVRFVE